MNPFGNGRHMVESCEGKQAFESAKLAHQVAKRRDRRGIVGKPYRCAFCSAWHIGTSGPSTANAKRRKFLETARGGQ